MLSATPRAVVAAPVPLLARLRLRAAAAAWRVPDASATAWAAVPERGRKRGSRQVAAAARAAAPWDPTGPDVRSSAGVEPAKLLGFRAVDLTAKTAEGALVGVVDSVSVAPRCRLEGGASGGAGC